MTARPGAPRSVSPRPACLDRGWTGLVLLALAALALLLSAPRAATGQPYEVSWYTVDGGGATALAGGSFVLAGTTGQPDAGPTLAGAGFQLTGGFWGGVRPAPQADLAVTKSDSPDPVTASQTLTYTLSVSNLGPDPATQVSVVDTLPDGVAFLSVAGEGWNCGEAGGIVTCTRPSLSVGAAPAITIQGSPPAWGAGATLINSVSVSGAETDPVSTNNSDVAATTLNPVPQADLAIVKDDAGASASWGQLLSYTITVTNHGPAAVVGALVADEFPVSLTDVSWTCAASSGAACTPEGSGDIADLVTLPTGTTVTYTVTGTVAQGAPTPLTNTATVAPPQGVVDPNPLDNSSTEETDLDDLIFADGFESRGLSRWSSAQTDGRDLRVRARAALAGTAFGLQAVVDDAVALYVQDDSPTDEGRYRARFYIHPKTFDPGAAGGVHRAIVFAAFEENPTKRLLSVILQFKKDRYSLGVKVRRDDGRESSTPMFRVSRAGHVVEIDWRRASAPGANDGSLELWIDGVSMITLSGLDNDLRRVDFVRLGVQGLRTGASGTLTWDEFESRRERYIGPLP